MQPDRLDRLVRQINEAADAARAWKNIYAGQRHNKHVLAVAKREWHRWRARHKQLETRLAKMYQRADEEA